MTNFARGASVVLALTAAACEPSFNPYLPDGGRALIQCDTAKARVAVKVLDLQGKAAPDATVNVANSSPGGLSFVGTTDARGVIDIVDDEVGEGLVLVNASLNDTKAAQAGVHFSCGECGCVASPSSLVMRLQ